MDEMQEEKAERRLDGRKIAVLGVAAVVAVLTVVVGVTAWRGHKQKLDETAIVTGVTDTTAMLREVLAKADAAAEAALRMDAHLARIKVANRTPLADAAEEYVLGAREIARKRADIGRLARSAVASRQATMAHLAAGKQRGDGWFKVASELKKRMERDYFELNTALKTLDTLYSGMPESVKRATPLFAANTLLPAGEFHKAAQETQDELKRVALELERARQLPLN